MKPRFVIVTPVILALAVPATMLAQAAKKEQITNPLVGTWRLISFRRTELATKEVSEPLGKFPKGYINFGSDGRMMVLFVGDTRPKPKDLATMTDQERAGLFKTMLALAGTYDTDGKTVTYHPDVSSNEIWTGTHQERIINLDGQKLSLTTVPHPASMDGKVSVIVVTFEKVD
jgi:hypothetical protein